MKNKEWSLFGVRAAAWVEIACFFFICVVIAFAANTDFNFFNFSPHPFWIAIILISAQYGTVAGLLAALVATIIYLAGPLPKQSILMEWNDYFFLLAKLPLLWFVSALILGELRMKHIRERDRLKKIADETEDREKQLAESYEALKKIKERLELRVAAEMSTTLIVLESFRKLEICERELVPKQACELIKLLVAPNKFSIFFLNENQLNLVISERWSPEDSYSKSFASTTPLFHEIVEVKRVVSITTMDSEILGSEGLLAIPILISPTDKALGMIKIELIPFQRITLSTIETLRVVGAAIGRNYEF